MFISLDGMCPHVRKNEWVTLTFKGVSLWTFLEKNVFSNNARSYGPQNSFELLLSKHFSHSGVTLHHQRLIVYARLQRPFESLCRFDVFLLHMGHDTDMKGMPYFTAKQNTRGHRLQFLRICTWCYLGNTLPKQRLLRQVFCREGRLH